MRIFEELEKIKQRGFIVAILFNFGQADINNTVCISQAEGEDLPDLMIQQAEDESIEKLLYRAVLSFDEKFPE